METSSYSCEVCIFCCKTSNKNVAEFAKKDNKISKQLSLNNGSSIVSRFVNFLERFGGKCEDGMSVNCRLQLHFSRLMGCCNVCGHIVDGFCEDYHKLKCLELEMEWKLERIKGIMKLAGRVPSRLRKIKSIVSDNDDNTGEQFVEKFKCYRQKIIKNCDKRLSKSQPRVNIARTDYSKHPILLGNEILTKKSQIERLKGTATYDEKDFLVDNSAAQSTDPQIKLESEQTTEYFVDMDSTVFEDDSWLHVDDIPFKTESSQDIQTTQEVEPQSSSHRQQDLPKKKRKPKPDKSSASVLSKKCFKKFSAQKGQRTQSYPCSECAQTFKTPRLRKKHVTLTHLPKTPPTKKFQCNECGLALKTKSALTDHIKTVHNNATPIPCEECGKPFLTERRLYFHKRKVHVTPSYQCRVCKKTFKTKYNLKVHEYVHSDPNSWRFKCEICGKPFYENAFLQNHLKNHSTGSNNDDQVRKDSTIPDRRNACCQICQVWFASRRELKGHFEKDHHDQLDLQGEELLNDGKQYPCSTCGKIFNNRWMLRRHTIRIHAPPNHTCDQCGKSFKTRGELKCHEMFHKGESARNIQCAECGKLWFRKSDLAAHIIRMHGKGKESSACQICGKTFANVLCLQRHMGTAHKNDKYSSLESAI